MLIELEANASFASRPDKINDYIIDYDGSAVNPLINDRTGTGLACKKRLSISDMVDRLVRPH